MNAKPESGNIQLDNQGIQIKVLMPSGRIRILDKVAGLEWVMRSGNASGAIWIDQEGEEKKYTFGYRGKRGILFQDNVFSVRSGEREDFHDVTLTGPLGDDPEMTVTIRYLLSSVHPVVDFQCYASVPNRVRKIQFPLGFHLPSSMQNKIYLPLELKNLKPLEEMEPQLPLWEPVEKENHLIAGSPFFIQTKQQEENTSSCIGYLSHPLCQMEIVRTSTGRCLSPLSPRPEESGCSEIAPHTIRYQFFPSNDLRALYWLCHEHLISEA